MTAVHAASMSGPDGKTARHRVSGRMTGPDGRYHLCAIAFERSAREVWLTGLCLRRRNRRCVR
jgi:hypothetical protein